MASIETKENFFLAFWRLFQQSSVADISVGKLTKCAGYNRSTFYEYFRDIYDLLDQFEQSVIQRFCRILNARSFTDGRFNGLESYLQGFLEAYMQYGEYFSVLLGDRGDPAFAGKLMGHIMDFWRARNVDTPALLEYACPAFLSILNTWQKADQKIPFERLMQVVLSAVGAAIEESKLQASV